MVDSVHRIQITLTLEPHVEPIRGVLIVDDRPTTFSGWLELAALIDAARRLYS
jgi:hypothetical protein